MDIQLTNYLKNIENENIESIFIPYIKKLLYFIIDTELKEKEQNTIESIKNFFNSIKITSSNGSSVVIILKNYNFIYQIYPNNITFNKVKNTVINITYSKFIVNYVKILDDFNTICFEKIKPINNFEFKPTEMAFIVSKYYSKIKIDIFKALEFLHKECNYSHGDVTIDNIGFDIKNNNFVLFDFDKAIKIKDKEDCNIQRDYHLFEKSIEYYSKLIK